MAKIKEIFTSIQGEGPYIGYKQLFIRFCGCNLSCSYCDTDFDKYNSKEYSINELIDICNQNADCHSISLTGGEPLLQADYIKELCSYNLPMPIYLETNGTLADELNKVIEGITYICADIKLPSATNLPPLWEKHEKFFEIGCEKELFAKVVFDNNITNFEIHKITHLCKKYNVGLILQPMMRDDVPAVDSTFMETVLNKCLKVYSNTRLIPQVHKFLHIM